MTIKDVKKLLDGDNVSKEELATLAKDSRSGIKKLLVSYQKKQEKLAKKRAAFLERFRYERNFWAKGQTVAGIDEVGRGPLAGPVVTAAVIVDDDLICSM